MMAFLLLLIAGCDTSKVDPCTQMCTTATTLYEGCLETWGITWEDAHYVDSKDFQNACETWAWELRLLEDDAVKRDILEGSGVVDETCRKRRSRLRAPDADCETYSSIDWSELPWSE